MQANEGRRQFVCRLLTQLVEGPFPQETLLCDALMQAEAAPVAGDGDEQPPRDAAFERCTSLGRTPT
jgi:hypothetical protein